MKERIHEIDVVKGIGMFLVILQHCISVAGGVESNLSKIILSFHMPLFFFASGLLASQKSISEILIRKTSTLLAPVVFYSIINAFIRSILHLLSLENYYSAFSFAGFWFLLSLLYINIFDVFCDKYLVANVRFLENGKILIGIISVCFGLFFSTLIVGKEVTVATALVGYGFYILGGLCKTVVTFLGNYNDKIGNRSILLMIGMLIFALLFFLCHLNTKVLMYESDYGNPVLFLMNSIVGIIGTLCIAFSIKKNSVLEFFGKNSLVILITHFPIHHICVKCLSILLNDSNMWIIAVLGFFITCIIEFLITLLIKERFPVLTGKINV